MAYRFKIDEPFSKGFRRIAAEQIGQAEQQLSQLSAGPVQVHESRKNFKRLRALLRLMRPALGEAAFRRENARLRDIAGKLSRQRDLQVIVETIAKLGGAGGPGLATAMRKLGESVAASRDSLTSDGAPARPDGLLSELSEARASLSRIRLAGEGFELVEQGLKRSYGTCRRRFDEAFSDPTEAALHEWRKTVQHHWRHMLLLSRAWPEMILPRARAARQLSDLLGEDHDHALLRSYVESHADLPLTSRERRRILDLCVARQADLRQRACPLGERLLAESPRQLCRRLSCYWDAATRLGTLEATEQALSGPRRRAADRNGLGGKAA